jgi:drug/metabolite transporter (DMT)-like permease
MFVFAAYVLQRYISRRKLYFLFWGTGLLMFAIASLSGALLTLDWNNLSFFTWYLFGALLTAAWIGQGTVYLLMAKRRAHILSVILISASLVAAVMLFRVMPDLDTSIYTTSESIGEQYRDIMPPIDEGGVVRLLTPFFNVYGLVTLVGGALWSSYLFWRKRVLPNRVIGNVLIAAGALVIASAGLLTRMGLGSVLYVGELVAAIMMFGGFLIAAKPSPVRETEEQVAAPAG